MPLKSQEQEENFETAFKKLEQIVREFEHNEIDLEQGLNKFKYALELASRCKKRLDEVENKIITIKKEFADFTK